MQTLELALCSKIETSSDLVSLAKYGARPKIKVTGSKKDSASCLQYDLIQSLAEFAYLGRQMRRLR